MNKTRTDRDFYRKIYDSGEGPWSQLTELDQRTDRWLEEIDNAVPQPRRMLDLGTGLGRVVRLFRSRGYQAVRIDYLLDPLLEAHRRSANRGGSFAVADAFKLPFTRRTFASLVDYGLLHHVRKRNWSGYRQTILSRLVSGGYYFVSVFHESDEHADRKSRDWVYHRGHYDRFFDRTGLDEFLGTDFDRKDSGLIEDGDHTFLHALYRKVSLDGT